MAKIQNDYQMKNLIDGSNLSLIKSFLRIWPLIRLITKKTKGYFTTIQNFNKDRFDLDIQPSQAPLATQSGNASDSTSPEPKDQERERRL